MGDSDILYTILLQSKNIMIIAIIVSTVFVSKNVYKMCQIVYACV